MDQFGAGTEEIQGILDSQQPCVLRIAGLDRLFFAGGNQAAARSQPGRIRGAVQCKTDYRLDFAAPGTHGSDKPSNRLPNGRGSVTLAAFRAAIFDNAGKWDALYIDTRAAAGSETLTHLDETSP